MGYAVQLSRAEQSQERTTVQRLPQIPYGFPNWKIYQEWSKIQETALPKNQKEYHA